MTRLFGSLGCISVAIGLLLAAPIAAQDVEGERAATVINIDANVREASLRFGIPEQWIYAVMRVESAGRIGATSPVGAMGLMQLMPGTWGKLSAHHGLGTNAYDPRANILAGAAYLREMHDRYGSPGFLAAYNAGPGRYEDWRDRGRRLPPETRAYVAKIAPRLQSPSNPVAVSGAIPVQPVRVSWKQSQLFAIRGDATADASGSFAAAARPEPIVAPTRPLNTLFAFVSGSRSQ